MRTDIQPEMVLPTPTATPRPPTAPTVCSRPGEGETEASERLGPLLHSRSEWRARPSSAELGGAGRWGRFGAIGRDELPGRPQARAPDPGVPGTPSGARGPGPGLLRRPRDRRALLSSPSRCDSATAAVPLPSRFQSCRTTGPGLDLPEGQGGVGVRLWRGGREERPRARAIFKLDALSRGDCSVSMPLGRESQR